MAKAFEEMQIEVKDTLERLQCIKVLGASSRHGDMRFLCRVTDEAKWLRAVSLYVMREPDQDWYSFVGKKYMPHQGRPAYAWVLMFEGEDNEKLVRDVRSEFSKIGEVLGIPQESIEEEVTNAIMRPPWSHKRHESTLASAPSLVEEE